MDTKNNRILKNIEKSIQKYKRKNKKLTKRDRKFIYNAFFRPNPPAILRLACLQLIRENVDFTRMEKDGVVWNLIWDRAVYLVKGISKTKEAKELHTRVLNERTF